MCVYFLLSKFEENMEKVKCVSSQAEVGDISMMLFECFLFVKIAKLVICQNCNWSFAQSLCISVNYNYVSSKFTRSSRYRGTLTK